MAAALIGHTFHNEMLAFKWQAQRVAQGSQIAPNPLISQGQVMVPSLRWLLAWTTEPQLPEWLA